MTTHDSRATPGSEIALGARQPRVAIGDRADERPDTCARSYGPSPEAACRPGRRARPQRSSRRARRTPVSRGIRATRDFGEADQSDRSGYQQPEAGKERRVRRHGGGESRHERRDNGHHDRAHKSTDVAAEECVSRELADPRGVEHDEEAGERSAGVEFATFTPHAKTNTPSQRAQSPSTSPELANTRDDGCQPPRCRRGCRMPAGPAASRRTRAGSSPTPSGRPPTRAPPSSAPRRDEHHERRDHGRQPGIGEVVFDRERAQRRNKEGRDDRHQHLHG